MKLIKDAKELYKVSLTRKSNITRAGIPDPDINEIVLMTKDTVDFYEKYYKNSVKIIESVNLGKLWPNNCTVEVTESYSRNCYSRQYYQIKSDNPLTEYDIDILRAQGCFMSGQVCGAVDINKPEIINNKYCYFANSICDSGD